MKTKTIFPQPRTHVGVHASECPVSAASSIHPRERGGVLVVTIIFCALVGIILTAYLSMLKTQHKMVHRSRVWNDCIPLCEAGIEEALAHINYTGTSTNFGINGWALSANAYRKVLNLNDGTVRIAISNDIPPTLYVNGSVKAPLAGTNSLARNLRVGTRLNQRFAYALLAKGNITCNSSGARVDSYDSTDPLKSTLGQYDPLKAGDKATLATTSKQPNAIDIGNLSLYGYAGTGPGGTVGINNGNVGSTAFNDNPINDGKIEKGHTANDINVYIPDPTLPGTFVSGAAPGGGTIGLVTYKYILSSGDWTLSSLNLGSSERIIVTGTARLLVTGSTLVSGEIDIAPGGNLEFYTTGNADFKGSINNPGLPKDLSVFGLKGCNSVSYSGGASFVGTVNAPQASVTITGGSAFYGAIIANTAKVTGGLSIHYDEALKGNPREGRFIVASYQEL